MQRSAALAGSVMAGSVMAGSVMAGRLMPGARDGEQVVGELVIGDRGLEPWRREVCCTRDSVLPAGASRKYPNRCVRADRRIFRGCA